jgi:hypothetical protein
MPEEIHWFVNRLHGAWGSVAMAIVLFHFAIPFFLLLHKPIKRNLRTLLPIAMILFAARYIDLVWYVIPNFSGNDPRSHFSWMDLASPIAIVGFWVAAFCWQLRSRPLFPVYDPLWTEVEKLHGH